MTWVGAQFVTEVRPAYRGFLRAFDRATERAMRGALEELRIGFIGMVYEEITATFRTLHDQYGVAAHTHEVPLGSPFATVRDGR